MTTVPRRLAAQFVTLAALILVPLGASALERVGPIDPGLTDDDGNVIVNSNGYPVWYQDDTGITLDLCLPADVGEAAFCALPETPPQGFPEFLPANWVGEHFYWSADATADTGAIDARLVLALESTFEAEEVVPGQQVVFGRLRIRVDPIPNGQYRVYTPYGVRDFPVTAGEINQTWDLGIACPRGRFDCALQSDIDRFLVPADAPGGNELAPVTFQGRRYLANPGVPTRVTGSRAGDANGEYTLANGQKRNANIFLVERISPNPAIVVETYFFEVSGRLFDGTVVADVKVDRASYAHDGAGNQVDVYATGFPARPSRTPGQPLVNPTPPTVAFYTLPCAGPENGPYSAPAGVPVPLARSGEVYWAQEEPAVLPAALCVRKELPGEAVTYEAIDPLGDQVFVTKALYTAATRTLQVEASSSDVFDSELELGRFGALTENIPFVNGVASVVLPQGQAAPPATINVYSNQHGQGSAEVTTRAAAAVPPADGVTLSADQPSPHLQGTEVVWTAEGSGSSGYEYQFWLKSGGIWNVVQPYSSTATWTMPASQPVGTYEVSVWVRTPSTAGSFDKQAVVNYQIVAPANPPATSVTLLPNQPSPHTQGTEVVWTAEGFGSTGYEYQFWVNAGGTWTIVQPYSATDTWTMPANQAVGTYSVAVWVRTNSTAGSFDKQATVSYQITAAATAPATSVTLEPSAPSPHTQGTEVVWTAEGFGSTGYEYQFWVNTGGTWTIVQPYSATATWTMPADQPVGTYGVAVWVRTGSTVTSFDRQATVNFVVQ